MTQNVHVCLRYSLCRPAVRLTLKGLSRKHSGLFIVKTKPGLKGRAVGSWSRAQEGASHLSEIREPGGSAIASSRPTAGCGQPGQKPIDLASWSTELTLIRSLIFLKMF